MISGDESIAMNIKIEQLKHCITKLLSVVKNVVQVTKAPSSDLLYTDNAVTGLDTLLIPGTGHTPCLGVSCILGCSTLLI